MNDKLILDACCGSRMFWFDKAEPHTTYIDNWNEDQVPQREVIQAIKRKPLFGDRRAKTHWMTFMKIESDEGCC